MLNNSPPKAPRLYIYTHTYIYTLAKAESDDSENWSPTDVAIITSMRTATTGAERGFAYLADTTETKSGPQMTTARPAKKDNMPVDRF